MKKSVERDLSRIGWLDYVLMSLGSCLAVYSAGMSIQLPSVAYFCVVLVIVGTCFSYGVRVLSFKSIFIKFDALFYGAAVICSIFFSSELRALMPDDGFPREIVAAGWLSWMLILGSFATWQDSTLLFQAIPALALFGLVGCYDTFRNVTFAFFGFLICLATLFARAHGREMLQKSADSGYFTRGLAPGTPIPSVETTPGLALKLKQGPWRWVAGPEWALVSALGVILISLLGAPVIQQSVSGVAGFVRINTPTSKPRYNPANTQAQDVTGQSVRIGRPYPHYTSHPLFRAKLDHERYLRAEAYGMYSGHGWVVTPTSQAPVMSGPGDTNSGTIQAMSNMSDFVRAHMRDQKTFKFELELLRGLHLLPAPPQVIDLQPDGCNVKPLDDGTYELSTLSGDTALIKGTSVESGDPSKLKDKLPVSGPYLDLSWVSPRVKQLAEQVTQNCKTDYAKAQAIQNEISKRIVYNLDAAETPADRDPVDYSLFDLKQGYCTAFASSMVLMARSVGIPARYVQGYLPDARRLERDGRYMITDADYHAWAELSFDGAGWVAFDPSVGAESVPNEGLGDTGDDKPWYKKNPLLLVLDILIVVVVFVVGAIGVQSIRSTKRPNYVRTELDGLYVNFSRRLEKALGRRRPVGYTASEFLELVRPNLGAAYPLAKAINEQFVRGLYSPDAMDLQALDKLRQDLKQFKQVLKTVPKQPRQDVS